MEPTLALFSGLPGTGKSTLATRLADELGWSLLAIDHLAHRLPSDTDWGGTAVWDGLIARLLGMAERRLRAGESVVIDSVFMDLDRFHARAVAETCAAGFRPVHTFISDEAVWRRRVTHRYLVSDPADAVASWPRVQTQRSGFRTWEPGTALFVDAMRPVRENLEAVLAFVTDPDPRLVPLPELPFTPGRYHG